MELAATPPEDVRLPAAVRRLAGSRSITPVWRNELGGLTFRLGGPSAVYVKWLPAEAPVRLSAEAERLRWAVRHGAAVPRIVDRGADADGEWLVTEALQGRSAVDPAWRARPAEAVAAIGAGLRALHDSLPVEECPYDWSAASRLDRARQIATAGGHDPQRWHDIHRSLSVPEALALAEATPPADVVVVCHGDACAPNTLLDDSGAWSGHVDFGEMGVADRWADLAVASWSASWNYGPGWEDALLRAYGVDRDSDRIGYYRLLWDLS